MSWTTRTARRAALAAGLAATGVVTATVAFVPTASTAQTSVRPGSDVTVTNDATRPVPVAPQGTTPVSGTVNVGNLPATQQVGGTVNVGNLPSTQTVQGTVGIDPSSNTVKLDPSSSSVSLQSAKAVNLRASGSKALAQWSSWGAGYGYTIVHFISLPVPEGKSFQVRSASVGAYAGNAACSVTMLTVQRRVGPSSRAQGAWLVPQKVSATDYVANEEVLVPDADGAFIQVHCPDDATKLTGSLGLEVSFSGELFDS
jgi:hypothetical protein